MMFAKHSKVFKCVVNKAQVLLCIANQNPQKRMQALCGESTEIVNEPSNIEKACFDIYYDAIDSHHRTNRKIWKQKFKRAAFPCRCSAERWYHQTKFEVDLRLLLCGSRFAGMRM